MASITLEARRYAEAYRLHPETEDERIGHDAFFKAAIESAEPWRAREARRSVAVVNLDAIVERMRAERPGLGITRSDVIREALFDYVDRRSKAERERFAAESLDLQGRLVGSDRAFLTEPDPKKPQGRR